MRNNMTPTALLFKIRTNSIWFAKWKQSADDYFGNKLTINAII